tara:strand:+ start:677 stop:931 length:255 start_codon:yes stop_codon:yes gene_type:complete
MKIITLILITSILLLGCINKEGLEEENKDGYLCEKIIRTDLPFGKETKTEIIPHLGHEYNYRHYSTGGRYKVLIYSINCQIIEP